MSQPPQLPDFSSGAPGQNTGFERRRPPQPPKSKLIPLLVIGGVALIVVVSLVLGLTVFRSALSGSEPEAADATAAPSEDSAPFGGDKPAEPTSLPSATPSDSPPPPDPSPTITDLPTTDCDAVGQGAAPDHPADKRVHGGNLSFPQLQGDWSDPKSGGSFPNGYDISYQLNMFDPDFGWASNFNVGALQHADAYPGNQQAAEAMLQCTATSDYYKSVDVKIEDFESKETTVDRKEGWLVEATFTFDEPELDSDASVIRIVTVEGSDVPSFFFGAVPREEPARVDDLATTVENLRVS